MNFNSENNDLYTVEIGVSPRKADVALVSIKDTGNLGELNSYVLKEYGYLESDLPDAKSLTKGYSYLLSANRKPIIFIVTIANDSTEKLLYRNLINSLYELSYMLKGKIVWMPLMGTGAGELTFDLSYSIIIQAIIEFSNTVFSNVKFLISLPSEGKSYEFLNKLGSSNLTEEFLKSFSNKIYFVGSVWGNDNQMSRFLSEGIWQKGFDDETYSSVINKVEKGDILILKSTFASNSISYLRAKAIGIVIKNLQDGLTLEVAWKIPDLWIDIEGLGFYRNTINPANIKDAAKVFEKVEREFLKRILPKIPISKIAGLVNDSEQGVDYLDITKDVLAFAQVIAAKTFQPPLAIALFGRWGSGKSFFMRKLEAQIKDCSTRISNHMYCSGIAHIRFNAWSYMDANLWASFVTKIFEGLNEYITENTLSEIAKKEIELELKSSLNITKDEVAILTEKSISLDKRIDVLKCELKKLENETKAKIIKIRTETAWNVINNVNKEFDVKSKIDEAFHKNSTYDITEKELKEIIPEKYWTSPIELYHQISSKYVFLKEFFRKGKIIWNLLCLSLIIISIFCIPLLLEILSAKIARVNFLVPQAVLSLIVVLIAALKRAENVYRKIRPLIAFFWNIKEEYEKNKEEALAKFSQEQKVLKLEIEKNEEELVLIKEHIQTAESLKVELEFKIGNAIGTEALYSFIDKKSKSDDYKKHLGIISIIRRDFEILNSLFTDHNQEKVGIYNNENFRSKFKKPLERIVLYVDDLDRCPEENVIQVLEAVNLLMAFPLFVVIVGVDPRWVKNALTKKFSTQFIGSLADFSDLKANVELVEPSNYLEKIFQIPFCLKEASNNNVKDMIGQLARLKPLQVNVYSKDNMEEASGISAEELQESNENDSRGKTNIFTSDELKFTIHEEIGLLELSEQEISMMQDIGILIGSSPRAIKRFVNIYRVVKAHEDFGANSLNSQEDLLAAFFLLALSLGTFNNLISEFETFVGNGQNGDKPLGVYLQMEDSEGYTDPLKQQLNTILLNIDNRQAVLQISAATFKSHYSFLKRFTFNGI